MTVIRIIKNWDEPDLLRQTPKGEGIWDSIKFTLDPNHSSDYTVVLNYIPDSVKMTENQDAIWALMQEPYIPGKFDWVVQGHERFSKVFTHILPDKTDKYYPSQTCLPWHINRSYDELAAMGIPVKTRDLSWITSNKTAFPGHKLRMQFYQEISTRKDLEIDLFGYGIRPIQDKWQGLGLYKYSLAIENSSGEHYWTEKLADCFLSYCLPFYFGCKNLIDYFPEESFVQIDINEPEHAIELMQSTIKSRQWEKRLDAIIEARRLVLNDYQLFPFIANKVQQM